MYAMTGLHPAFDRSVALAERASQFPSAKLTHSVTRATDGDV